MNEYDKIPQPEIDYEKDAYSLVQDWIASYYHLRAHCSDKILALHQWRLIAGLGWLVAAVLAVALITYRA